jgi:hypothetical protein
VDLGFRFAERERKFEINKTIKVNDNNNGGKIKKKEKK